MSSGDGLLVRIRAASRALQTSELRAICELARAHGNGQIELTRRANLQLRGVRESALPELRDALTSLCLLAPSLELEQRLNLLVSPLAGLDPRCAQLPDLSAAIESALLAEGPLPGMPSKFGIVLDVNAGALADVFADVRVEQAGELAHLFVAGDRASAHWLGACVVARAPAAVVRLLRSYAALGSDARHDAPAWLAAGGRRELQAQLSSLLVDAQLPAAGVRAEAATFLGKNAGWFGLGVPFGSATDETWRELAQLADVLGDGRMRMTPWRSVLLPGARDAAALAREAERLGLIWQPGDALQRVDACPGAPACASALGETRQLARELALELCAGESLHVSGCSKGCAHRGPASITLVQDSGGCRVGFDLDSAQTSTGTVVPLRLRLNDARAQLRVWREKRARGTQA